MMLSLTGSASVVAVQQAADTVQKITAAQTQSAGVSSVSNRTTAQDQVTISSQGHKLANASDPDGDGD